MHAMNISVKLSRFVALLASLVTLAQIVLLVNEQEGICLNDGCAVVDSLTTVPPLYFSIAGFVFFQLLYWSLWFAQRNRSGLWLINWLLLAGLAAEGVLFSFQHFVARTFCSYCLLILGFVVLLNLLAGWRQIVHGAAVFAAVVLGFAVLQFGGAARPLDQLDNGTFAVRGGDGPVKRYLFFSSTCKYCEEVIEALRQDRDCQVQFNPIDRIDTFTLEAERRPDYDPHVNRLALQSLGFDQIPVLLVSGPSGFEVIQGSGAILRHFDATCAVKRQPAAPQSSLLRPEAGFVPPAYDFLPPQDEACGVETECESPSPQATVPPEAR